MKGKVPDGWTTLAIQHARDEAYANGRTPILLRDFKRAEAMVEAARKQLRNHQLGLVFDESPRQSRADAYLA